MERKIFERFRALVYEKSGISLGDQKEALVSARVGKRMRTLNFDDYEDYLNYVAGDSSGQELVQLIDAISTNVTSFYREAEHFDFLQQALQRWAREGQRRFRLWSAACSSGEEPYTIAMTVLETLDTGCDIKILATDISTRVLEKAQHGEYSAERMEGVPSLLRERYFTRVRDADSVRYVATSALTKLIAFRRINLSRPPFPMRGPLDAVFCRNVMIYFDNTVRARLLAEIYRLLRPGGFLMVGHAESLTGMVSDFRTVRPSIYSKGKG